MLKIADLVDDDSEAILNLNIEARGVKDPVNQVFQSYELRRPVPQILRFTLANCDVVRFGHKLVATGRPRLLLFLAWRIRADRDNRDR